MQIPLDSSILTTTQAAEVKKYQQLAENAVEEQQAQLLEVYRIEEDIITTKSTDAPTFLSITSRNFGVTGNSWVSKWLGYEDVISGDVEDEIQAVVSETESIAAAMEEAKKEINYAKVPTVNVKDYGETGTTECSASTSLTRVSAAIEKGDYNKSYGSGRTALQYKNAILDAFNKTVAYLDDLIANYDTKVAAGLAAGHQEVKLTTLLQMRNAIRNCDVTINIEDTHGKSVDYGAYYQYGLSGIYSDGTNSYVIGTPTDYDEYANTPDGPQYLKIVRGDLDRHYRRQVNFPSHTLDQYIEYANLGVTDVYLMSTIIHEFTHALHIPNETVAYLMGEIVADDKNYPLEWAGDWANPGYGYGGTLDTDDEVLYFGDWWEKTSQGSVDKVANASEFANYTANPTYNKNAAINKRFTA